MKVVRWAYTLAVAAVIAAACLRTARPVPLPATDPDAVIIEVQNLTPWSVSVFVVHGTDTTVVGTVGAMSSARHVVRGETLGAASSVRIGLAAVGVSGFTPPHVRTPGQPTYVGISAVLPNLPERPTLPQS